MDLQTSLERHNPIAILFATNYILENVWTYPAYPFGPSKITRLMTIEEYKAQPFKDATIGDYWYTFDRKTRREIERLVRKGKNPDIMRYL